MTLTTNQIAAIEALRGTISSEDWSSMRDNDANAANVIIKYSATVIPSTQQTITFHQATITTLTNQAASLNTTITTLEAGVTDSQAYLTSNPPS